MAHRVDSFLAKSLATGPLRFGELVVFQVEEGFEVRHRDDVEREGLETFLDAEDAVEIAKWDDRGLYRPLKSAPNLRHRWRLVVANIEGLRIAIDYFYPARLAALLAHQAGTLATTPLRATLVRQSGIYRVTANISDQQIDQLVAGFCRSDAGCLRTILWKRDETGAPASTRLPSEKFDPAHDQTGRGEAAMPLLCQEACNLLIAEARRVVKGER
jgi:sirohydrochlorin cobaltochelatase